MLPQNKPDRIRILFDDHRLVANAGLLLPATLARHLGLRELVDHHLDLGGAPGRANTGDKMLTLVASALAGGDCIDDADALRAGGTVGVLGCVVKAPSTLGTFLRSFRWGHVRQLDRVSRELLSRAWAAGTGPGEGPLTIDLDSISLVLSCIDKPMGLVGGKVVRQLVAEMTRDMCTCQGDVRYRLAPACCKLTPATQILWHESTH